MKKIGYLFLIFGLACSTPKKEKAEQLYNTHCASCHIAPSPQDLPKYLWKETVLPEMGARMGMISKDYHPFEELPFSEQSAIIKAGVYNIAPTISQEEWSMIQNYIIEEAPEAVPMQNDNSIFEKLEGFQFNTINVDSVPGSSISFLKIDSKSGKINFADLKGNILSYDYKSKNLVRKRNYGQAITSYNEMNDSIPIITTVGRLNPSEIPAGAIIIETSDSSINKIGSSIHRPVHTTIEDLNKDGNQEILVCEFGHLTGALSIFTKDELGYQKRTLLNVPGVLRTIVKDMNADGKLDIVAMTSQGNEGISIFYQTEDLKFHYEQVVRFSPVYGSSWFDLVDYNGDGFDDIITVNGDNADKTYINKPYHGLRILINDGSNSFHEEFFYPLNGATRFSVSDFDMDGDIDFAIIAAFPDYQNKPESSFVYLENINSKNYDFETYSLEQPSKGRWLLIDAADIDGDQDTDIVISSFTYQFTPVPDNLQKLWTESNTDLMILENSKF